MVRWLLIRKPHSSEITSVLTFEKPNRFMRSVHWSAVFQRQKESLSDAKASAQQ